MLGSWVPLPRFSRSAELVGAETGVGAALPRVSAAGTFIFKAGDEPQAAAR